jgi:hypothetical protein
MKYVISFLFSISALASPINIFYEDNDIEAIMYRDILIADYKIPEELIVVRPIKSCEVLKGEGKLDLCLKNNGDILMISVNRDFINESLKVFQSP